MPQSLAFVSFVIQTIGSYLINSPKFTVKPACMSSGTLQGNQSSMASTSEISQKPVLPVELLRLIIDQLFFITFPKRVLELRLLSSKPLPHHTPVKSRH